MPSAAARRKAFCVLPAMVWRSSWRGAERHAFNAGKAWGRVEHTVGEACRPTRRRRVRNGQTLQV